MSAIEGRYLLPTDQPAVTLEKIGEGIVTTQALEVATKAVKDFGYEEKRNIVIAVAVAIVGIGVLLHKAVLVLTVIPAVIFWNYYQRKSELQKAERGAFYIGLYCLLSNATDYVNKALRKPLEKQIRLYLNEDNSNLPFRHSSEMERSQQMMEKMQKSKNVLERLDFSEEERTVATHQRKMLLGALKDYLNPGHRATGEAVHDASLYLYRDRAGNVRSHIELEDIGDRLLRR
ncbi:MAG: hypothetical protein H0X51_08730 [Parachlamydiaceae bacterium]|nr:hypothetical protein [Parachlamydiaceae bacterium]